MRKVRQANPPPVAATSRPNGLRNVSHSPRRQIGTGPPARSSAAKLVMPTRPSRAGHQGRAPAGRRPLQACPHLSGEPSMNLT